MNRLIEKYKNLSKPVKASMWFVVSNVLLKGISFITLPIFSRLMSTSDYGIVSVYQSWISIVSIITTLTIWGGVFNVGMVKHGDDRDRIISSFQGLATTITVVALVIVLIVLNWLSDLFGISKLLVVLMFIEVLSQIPYNLWSSKQRYDYEYRYLILVSVLIAVFNPLIGVIAVINSPNKAEARIISGLIVSVGIGVISFVINQKKGKCFFHKEYWDFAFKFNIVLVPHYLSMQVLNQSDRVMINRMCGSSDAGIYSVAYNFAMLIQWITTAINSSLTPYIYETLKNGDVDKLKKQINGVVGIVAIITMGVICIVPDVFTFLLPASYHPSIWAIPPVTAAAFFMFIYPLFGAVEFYYEENKYVTYASLIGAGVNIVLNFIFIKMFGFIAAAYTTLFCYILFSYAHYFFMKKILKKNKQNLNLYDYKTIFLICVAIVVFSLVMVPLYDKIVLRWAIVGVILIIALINGKRIMALIHEMF